MTGYPHIMLILMLVIPLAGAALVGALKVRLGAWMVFVVCGLTLVAAGFLVYGVVESGILVYRVGGWPPPYGIVLVADMLAVTMLLIASVVAAASALHVVVPGEKIENLRAFNVLFLLLLTALNGVFLTGDVFNLYVFMELVILCSFGLVALANKPGSAEVTFKYAIISAIGSLMLLLGVAYVYAGQGTLNMADISNRLAMGFRPPFWSVAGAAMLFAFLVKGAIFPFHFWQPDATAAAPSPMAAMLSGVLDKVGLYGIIRLSVLIFPDVAIVGILGFLGAVSAIFGGITALANNDIKRALAYSTISNMGLILMAVAWGDIYGWIAAVVVLVNHALIKTCLFLGSGYVTERLGEQKLARLSGIAGLTAPGTIAFALGAWGIAGIPPLSGYLSKLALFQAAVANQDYVMLAVVAVASGLGIAYSVRLFVMVYWGQTPKTLIERWNRSRPVGTPISALLLAIVFAVIGVWPRPLIALANATAEQLTRVERYVAAVMGEDE